MSTIEPRRELTFWPIFPIVIWGTLEALSGYSVYRDEHYSKAQIQHEMEKLSGPRSGGQGG